MKIAYEKHPVSPERKAKLRSEGFKIIDARFDPDAGKKKSKAKAPAKQAEQEAPTDG